MLARLFRTEHAGVTIGDMANRQSSTSHQRRPRHTTRSLDPCAGSSVHRAGGPARVVGAAVRAVGRGVGRGLVILGRSLGPGLTAVARPLAEVIAKSMTRLSEAMRRRLTKLQRLLGAWLSGSPVALRRVCRWGCRGPPRARLRCGDRCSRNRPAVPARGCGLARRRVAFAPVGACYLVVMGARWLGPRIAPIRPHAPRRSRSPFSVPCGGSRARRSRPVASRTPAAGDRLRCCPRSSRLSRALDRPRCSTDRARDCERRHDCRALDRPGAATARGSRGGHGRSVIGLFRPSVPGAYARVGESRTVSVSRFSAPVLDASQRGSADARSSALVDLSTNAVGTDDRALRSQGVPERVPAPGRYRGARDRRGRRARNAVAQRRCARSGGGHPARLFRVRWASRGASSAPHARRRQSPSTRCATAPGSRSSARRTSAQPVYPIGRRPGAGVERQRVPRRRPRSALLWPEGGTAMGQWLLLAQELFASRPRRDPARDPAHRREEREREPRRHSMPRSATCAGQFQCDCRGIGTDWNVAELRDHLVASARHGRHRRRPRGARRRLPGHDGGGDGEGASPGATLRVWTPRGATLRYVKQVAPEIRDLTSMRTPVDALHGRLSHGRVGRRDTSVPRVRRGTGAPGRRGDARVARQPAWSAGRLRPRRW